MFQAIPGSPFPKVTLLYPISDNKSSADIHILVNPTLFPTTTPGFPMPYGNHGSGNRKLRFMATVSSLRRRRLD
jgi:hypothetical protein